MNGPTRKEYPDPEIKDGTFDAGTSHGKLLKLLRRGQRVLEFGCASGYMSRAMTEMGCRVVAIEIDPAAASQARAFCEEVIVADLDVRPLADVLPATRFDVAVFGDVLEHLRDPWRVLDDTRAFLSPGGYVAISIPNVAHGAVRLALLNGSFDYADVGLLDNTHLRFFTLKSVKELCVRSGYAIEDIDRTKVPMFLDTDVVPRVAEASVEPALLKQIVADPEHDTLQFIVRARPLSDSERTTYLFDQYHDAQLRLEEARKEIELLNARVETLSAQQLREEEDEMLLVEYARQVEELNLKNAELEDSLVARALANDDRDEERATLVAAGSEENELLLVDFARQVEELSKRNDELESELAEARGRIEQFEGRPQLRREEDELLLVDFARQVEQLSKENGVLESDLLAARERLGEIERLETEIRERDDASASALETIARLESELAQRTLDVEETRARNEALEAAVAAAEEVRDALAQTQARYELLEIERDGLSLQRETLEARNAELEGEAAGRIASLDEARRAVDAAEKRLSAVRELSRAAAEDMTALGARYEESERERNRIERLLHEELRRSAVLEQQRLDFSSREARLAEREQEIEHRIGQERDRLESEARSKSVAVEQLNEQLRESRQRAARLESELAAQRFEGNDRQRQSEEAAEVAKLKERARLLETELKLLVNMFLQHAEAELNRLRRESTSIDTAIRTTRTSAFWLAKTMANRVVSAPKRLLGRKKS